MSHSLIETAVGCRSIIPKPNFKTHVTSTKVYLIPLFSTSVKRHCLFCVSNSDVNSRSIDFNMYYILKQQFIESAYCIWHVAGWQPFCQRVEIETFHNKIKDWNKHLQTLKSYLTFCFKREVTTMNKIEVASKRKFARTLMHCIPSPPPSLPAAFWVVSRLTGNFRSINTP